MYCRVPSHLEIFYHANSNHVLIYKLIAPIVGRPDPSVSAVQDLGRRTFPTNSRPRKSCMICLEIYFGNETENQFPHKCHRCEKSAFCISCLKEWFIDACKNESKMPPKCCSIIPLSTVSNLLKKEQVSTAI